MPDFIRGVIRSSPPRQVPDRHPDGWGFKGFLRCQSAFAVGFNVSGAAFPAQWLKSAIPAMTMPLVIPTDFDGAATVPYVLVD